MAIGTTTQFAEAIQAAYVPGFTNAVFRNNEFLNKFPIEESMGDTAYRWKVNSAGNSSAATFTESSSMPTPVAQSWVSAAVNWVYFAASVRITGHARDAIKKQGVYAQFNALEQEMQLGFADLMDVVNTTFMGSTSGLEVAVDAGSTYGGISRGSATYWESLETSVGGALTHDSLMTLKEQLRDNDRGARPDMLLCPWNQVTNIANLPGAPGAANNSYRIQLDGSNINSGIKHEGNMFGELAVLGCPDVTNTVIFGLDSSTGIKTVQHRPFTVRQDISGDDDLFYLSWAGAFIVKDPMRNGKLTGVTA